MDGEGMQLSQRFSFKSAEQACLKIKAVDLQKRWLQYDLKINLWIVALMQRPAKCYVHSFNSSKCYSM